MVIKIAQIPSAQNEKAPLGKQIFYCSTGQFLNLKSAHSTCMNVNPNKVFPHNLRTCSPAPFTALKRTLQSLQTFQVTAVSIPQEFILSLPVTMKHRRRMENMVGYMKKSPKLRQQHNPYYVINNAEEKLCEDDNKKNIFKGK